MFESLESRELMSVTLPTADTTTVDTQPTTSLDVTAEKKTGKPNPSNFSFVHLYDKASPVIM